jgi:MoaA/NifB/PqqE/SkfB family radical SAM enzyme
MTTNTAPSTQPSKTFCILPWIHLNTWPNGNVYQCCITDYRNPCGNSRTHTFEQIWNNDYMRELRRDMLAGREHQGCKRCYTLEDSGLQSFRQSANQNFAHHTQPALEHTLPDGTSTEFKLAYWDFRFSNLCNFKCRMCGNGLSSSWYDDHVEMQRQHGRTVSDPRVIHIDDNSQQSINTYLDQFIDTVEEVYFAGGEPLIMPEHYYILDELVRRGRTDVRIRYNTNLSRIEYRGWQVLDYWSKFREVGVFASIDAVGARAEYIRSGTRWSTLRDNIQQIISMNPNCLGVNATVQMFNIFALPELIDELLGLGVAYHRILVSNIVTHPDFYSIQLLSPELKQQAAQGLQDYLRGQDSEIRRVFEPQFQGIINFMNGTRDDAERQLQLFVQTTRRLDAMRSERFETACPELAAWFQELEARFP